MSSRLLITALAAIALCVLPAYANAEDQAASNAQEERVRSAIDVLTEFRDIPETRIPPGMLTGAYGVAVIPNVIKAGFVIGGRRGRGLLTIRHDDGSWSNPTFITLTGGSIGWQIGGQSTDVILVFRSRRSVEGITSGKFTLGADAAVAAGPVGRQTGAATDARLGAEVYSYSRSRGLFLGVALEGASLSIDDGSNRAFYGNRALTADDVLYDRGLRSPAIAREFLLTLDAAAPAQPSRPAADDNGADLPDEDDDEEEVRVFPMEPLDDD